MHTFDTFIDQRLVSPTTLIGTLVTPDPRNRVVGVTVLLANLNMLFQQELASQSWALYGIGMFMILLRT